MNEEKMSIKLQLLLEAIEEIDRMEVESRNVIEESAKWKEHYDKTSDVKVAKGTSKQYGEFAARYGGGDSVRHFKDGGKAIADDSRNRMELDARDAENLARFRRVSDCKPNRYGHTHISEKMTESKELHDQINKRGEAQRKAMGESVEEHLAFVDTILELLD